MSSSSGDWGCGEGRIPDVPEWGQDGTGTALAGYDGSERPQPPSRIAEGGMEAGPGSFDPPVRLLGGRSPMTAARGLRKDASKPAAPQPLTNIQTIAKLDEEVLLKRSAVERVGDRLVPLAGSPGFALVHVVWFSLWIAMNRGVIPGVPVFDPYPFNFLTMAVSLEAIFITIGVLNTQNRMARLSDRRAQLDLQINLLAEQESTAALRLLQRVAERLGVPLGEPTPAELAEKTSVEDLVEKLDEKLPGP